MDGPMAPTKTSQDKWILVLVVVRAVCAVRAQVAGACVIPVVEINDAGLDIRSLSNGKAFSVQVETVKDMLFARQVSIFDLEATVPKC